MTCMVHVATGPVYGSNFGLHEYLAVAYMKYIFVIDIPTKNYF